MNKDGVFPVFPVGTSVLQIVRESIAKYGQSSCIQEISRDVNVKIDNGETQIRNLVFFDYSDDKESNLK